MLLVNRSDSPSPVSAPHGHAKEIGEVDEEEGSAEKVAAEEGLKKRK